MDNEIENNLYESQGVSGVVNSSPNYEDMIEKDDSSSDENQFTESALDKEFPENASTEQLNCNIYIYSFPESNFVFSFDKNERRLSYIV